MTEPGKYELEYKVSYPSGITNVSLDKRITPSVTVEAVEFAEKDVPVELVFQGEQQEGLILDQEEAMLSARASRSSLNQGRYSILPPLFLSSVSCSTCRCCHLASCSQRKNVLLPLA